MLREAGQPLNTAYSRPVRCEGHSYHTIHRLIPLGMAPAPCPERALPKSRLCKDTRLGISGHSQGQGSSQEATHSATVMAEDRSWMSRAE